MYNYKYNNNNKYFKIYYYRSIVDHLIERVYVLNSELSGYIFNSIDDLVKTIYSHGYIIVAKSLHDYGKCYFLVRKANHRELLKINSKNLNRWLR